MVNPWFKFYGGEYLSDPKIECMNSTERSCWITLLSLANASSVPGIIEYLTPEVLLRKSGVEQGSEEWTRSLKVLEKFVTMKMIKKNDNGGIEILNWSKRQDSNMNATERSRKFRLKERLNSKLETLETERNENETLEENRIDKKREKREGTYVPPLEINKVIESFKEINPTSYKRWFGNKTERSASQDLILTYGLVKVLEVVSILPEVNQIAWMPTITSPYKLLVKWSDLMASIAKKKNEREQKIKSRGRGVSV